MLVNDLLQIFVTNASRSKMREVFLTFRMGQHGKIAYISKTLTLADKNYCNTQKERVAVVKV